MNPMNISIVDLTRTVLLGLVTRFSESIGCLEAMLELDPWIGTSMGDRCRFCDSMWPDHVADCPRQAAERFIQSLSADEEE